MYFRTLTMALGVIIVVMSLNAQETTQKAALTSLDIEKMLSAKISEAVIVARVRQSGAPIVLSIDEIVALKKLGASDSFFETIMNPALATTVAAASPATSGKLEVGAYAKKGESWIALEPEIVNIKQSSAFKVYTGGVDTNGQIAGASSKTTLKTPIEIMLITPEGVSAAEYVLVRLASSGKKDNREFRVGRFGFGGGKSGVDRDKVAFDFKKLGPGQFTINLSSSVVAGEYSFLPPLAAGGGNFGGPLASGGKAYSFRVLE